MEIDCHLGAAMSGLTADARTMVDHARVETQQHRFTYNESMPVESCVQSLCDLAIRFGEDGDDDGKTYLFVFLLFIAPASRFGEQTSPTYLTSEFLKLFKRKFWKHAHISAGGMSRPFGVALLVAGWDEKGPALFHTDPSGTYVRYVSHTIHAPPRFTPTNKKFAILAKPNHS